MRSSSDSRCALRGIRGALLALVSASVLLSAPTPDADTTTLVDDAVGRLPWTRGPEWVQRQWMVLGPLTTAEADAVDSKATAAAHPGAEVNLPTGRSVTWRPQQAWGDVVEVSAAGAARTDPPDSAPHILLALAQLARPDSGDVGFALGCDVPTTLWLNGTPVGPELRPSAVVVPDHHRLTAPVRAGTNDVLLRLDLTASVSASARFIFRVEPAGALSRSASEIAPSVQAGADSALIIVTHLTVVSTAEPVQVSVRAPGGALVAQAEAPRGETVRFPTADWPDGPYEIRCSTRSAWNEPYATHLAWYKGDIVTAARAALTRVSALASDDPLDATQRVVADILRSRLDAGLDTGGDLVSLLARLHSPLMELAELELERQGRPARIRPGGFYRLAWIDDVDGSNQFCRAYLPPNYTSDRCWPVVISLHGYNPPNPPYVGWWSVDARHDARTERHDVIVLEPHGRGNAQYQWIGEQDVLRALEEANRRFSVDSDRVYLTGESMGGAGTWLIGSRHASRFAAIAPVFGGWDMRVAPPAGGDPRPLVARTAREAFWLERRSSFASAEQLLNVPILVHHGDADAAVSVENSRYITRQLQRWGYDIRYHEMPERGHEDLKVASDIVAWMLQHRRAAAPRQVRVRAADLLGASAHWLAVREFDAPWMVMAVDAEMVEPGQLRLDAKNVRQVKVSPPEELLAEGRRLNVVWNGESVWQGVVPPDGVTVRRGGGNQGSLAKRPGVEGPISDMVRTPFLVVIGTTSRDPVMRERCREKAEAFRALWMEWQHQAPRIVEDERVTEAELQQFSLILIGGPNENRIAQRFAGHVPLQVEPASITIDGRRWEVSDAVAQMIYPHPLHAERYVLTVAATSADGLYFWNPALWHVAIGFPTVQVDWQIQDGRRLLPGSSAFSDTLIAGGTFDAEWRRQDAWTLTGDADARARSPLRHAPAPGFFPSLAALARCAGAYELAPGVIATAAIRDQYLEVSIMGDPPLRFRAESDREFAHPLTGLPVVFEEDDAGRIASVLIYGDGGAIRAPRLESKP